LEVLESNTKPKNKTMLYLAIALFLTAAVFGVIIASAILRNQPTPKPLVFIHGLLGAAALTLVVVYVLKHADKNPMISLVLLVIAALGGFVLFARDMTKKPGPIALVLVHALVAVAGVIGLVLFVMP
jgi:hypothetical protein